MAPTVADSNDSPNSSNSETTENNLQPFFVLHKASSLQKHEKKSGGQGKARRRIDLSTASPKIGSTSEDEREDFDRQFVNGRMEIFVKVWSKMESTIKDVLREMNTNVFDEINKWIHQSFDTIKSFGMPTFSDATRAFPIVTDAASKQLFTGMVLTRNMEFVDDLLTFEELGQYLTSQGCHVANLSSLDFSVKNGIGGCLRSLLRQFLTISVDAGDISLLATWYREQGNPDKPVVVIIDDMERCCGSVLSDFILMLSEWVLKIPVILIMGVATTLDAPRSILASHVLHHLSPCKFVLGTPFERMDAIVQAVLVKQCSGFKIGHNVAVYLRNYFLSQDGTITSFLRALKMACGQHLLEPLSFLLLPFLLEQDDEVLESEKYGLSTEMILKHASDLTSYERINMAEQNGETLRHGLSELRKSQKFWSTAVLCLYEAGKYDKIRLIDLFCEALDPQLYKSRTSVTHKNSERDAKVFTNLSAQNSFIKKTCHKVRNLTVLQLSKLLNLWEKHTADIPQMHGKVEELLSQVKLEDCKNLKKDMSPKSKRYTLRGNSNVEDSRSANEEAATFLESMVREYLQPIECIPLHEIVCFKDVNKLQAALIGDPRRRIQIDLLEFRKIIQCSCCSRNDNPLSPSMPDSSILYILSQNHGDIINLHDWYQSFKSVINYSSNKAKNQRSKNHSPSPKKKKLKTEPAKPTEAAIQARFCRGVTELQITGLIRMPTKRRPDFVQRVAFGL